MCVEYKAAKLLMKDRQNKVIQVHAFGEHLQQIVGSESVTAEALLKTPQLQCVTILKKIIQAINQKKARKKERQQNKPTKQLVGVCHNIKWFLFLSRCYTYDISETARIFQHTSAGHRKTTYLSPTPIFLLYCGIIII